MVGQYVTVTVTFLLGVMVLVSVTVTFQNFESSVEAMTAQIELKTLAEKVASAVEKAYELGKDHGSDIPADTLVVEIFLSLPSTVAKHEYVITLDNFTVTLDSINYDRGNLTAEWLNPETPTSITFPLNVEFPQTGIDRFTGVISSSYSNHYVKYYANSDRIEISST